MPALLLALCVPALRVAVVGAQGALGREVVAQALARGWEVDAYVRRPDAPVRAPVRAGWLTPAPGPVPPPLVSPRLRIRDAAAPALVRTDAIVFALGGAPFRDDDTSAAVARHCDAHPRAAVCLVSAYGVGGGGGPAIGAMRGWYLRAAYAAKAAQERLVTARAAPTCVVRPRALSYARVPLNPGLLPRSVLAERICAWVAEAAA